MIIIIIFIFIVLISIYNYKENKTSINPGIIIKTNADKQNLEIVQEKNNSLIILSTSLEKDAIKIESTNGGIEIISNGTIALDSNGTIALDSNGTIALDSPDEIIFNSEVTELISPLAVFITKNFICNYNNTIKINSNDINTPALLKFEKTGINKLSKLEFYGNNISRGQVLYGQILCEVAPTAFSAATDSEDGKISLGILHNGDMKDVITIEGGEDAKISLGDSSNNQSIINFFGNTFTYKDFKLEGSTEKEFFAWDASGDKLNISGSFNTNTDVTIEPSSNSADKLFWDKSENMLLLGNKSEISFEGYQNCNIYPSDRIVGSDMGDLIIQSPDKISIDTKKLIIATQNFYWSNELFTTELSPTDCNIVITAFNAIKFASRYIMIKHTGQLVNPNTELNSVDFTNDPVSDFFPLLNLEVGVDRGIHMRITQKKQATVSGVISGTCRGEATTGNPHGTIAADGIPFDIVPSYAQIVNPSSHISDMSGEITVHIFHLGLPIHYIEAGPPTGGLGFMWTSTDKGPGPTSKYYNTGDPGFGLEITNRPSQGATMGVEDNTQNVKVWYNLKTNYDITVTFSKEYIYPPSVLVKARMWDTDKSFFRYPHVSSVTNSSFTISFEFDAIDYRNFLSVFEPEGVLTETSRIILFLEYFVTAVIN